MRAWFNPDVGKPAYDGGLSMLKGLVPTREEVEAAETAALGREFLDRRCSTRAQLLATTALALVA